MKVILSATVRYLRREAPAGRDPVLAHILTKELDEACLAFQMIDSDFEELSLYWRYRTYLNYLCWLTALQFSSVGDSVAQPPLFWAALAPEVPEPTSAPTKLGRSRLQAKKTALAPVLQSRSRWSRHF